MLDLEIKYLDGNIRTIVGDETDCIELLKSKIQDKDNIDPDKQRLIFKGQELKNGKLLSDYGLYERSEPWTIHCVIKEEHNLYLFKINKPDGDTLEVEYKFDSNTDNINHLKIEILRLTKINPKKYDLYLEDKLLQTSDLLKSCLEKGNTLTMKMR